MVENSETGGRNQPKWLVGFNRNGWSNSSETRSGTELKAHWLIHCVNLSYEPTARNVFTVDLNVGSGESVTQGTNGIRTVNSIIREAVQFFYIHTASLERAARVELAFLACGCARLAKVRQCTQIFSAVGAKAS